MLPNHLHPLSACKSSYGLQKHIENQVCTIQDDIPANQVELFQPDDLPLVQIPEVIEIVQTQGAVALAEFPEWCQKLSQHCCICNQWFSSNSSMGYHQHTHHTSAVLRGRQWAIEHVRSKVFVHSSPCKWCGQSYAQSTSHKCPVLTQLGILHSLLLEDGGPDSTHLSRADSADVRAVAAKQWKASCIARQPRRRSQKAKAKCITATQTSEGGRCNSTQSLYGDGSTTCASRRFHQQNPDGHHLPHVLGHFCPDVAGHAGHIPKMEIGARGGKNYPSNSHFELHCS